jgi:hypothetical protein
MHIADLLPRTLASFLLVTGAGCLLVFAVPGIVAIGSLFFIIPGLVLLAMPVAFGYGAAFALVRYCVQARVSDLRAAGAVAAALVALAGFGLPGLARIEALHRLDAARVADVTPAGPIALKGDLALQDQFSHGDCETRCRAILGRPAVTSVTVYDDGFGDFAEVRQGRVTGKGTTYRISARPECHSFLAQPEVAESCLSVGEATGDFDMIVRHGEWRDEAAQTSDRWSIRGELSVRLAEIRTKDAVLARASYPTVSALAIPLAAFQTCGGVYDAHMCWSRSRVGSIASVRDPDLPSRQLSGWLNMR